MNKSTQRHIKEDLLEQIAVDLTSFLEKAPATVASRLKHFAARFDREFPKEKESERGVAEAVVYALMCGPLFLYAIGMNGASVLELHAILERLTLEQTARRISKPSTKKNAEELAEKCNLPSLAAILNKLGVLEMGDVRYSQRLTRLRNGVAHRNPKAIANAVLSGKEITFLDIDESLRGVDCIALIIEAVRYLPRLTKH